MDSLNMDRFAGKMSNAPPEWDVLLSAAQKNQPDRIEHLIKSVGVDPSHANMVGQSSLHVAALWGNVEAVQKLIDCGASIDAKNNLSGATPLHCAVQSNKGETSRRVQSIEALLRAGANVSIPDFYKQIPFDYCDNNPSLQEKLLPQKPHVFKAIQELDMNVLSRILHQSPILVDSKFRGLTPFLTVLQQLVPSEDDDDDQHNNEGGRSDDSDFLLLQMFQILLECGSDPKGDTTGGAGNVLQVDNTGENHDPLHRICSALQTAYRESNREEEEKQKKEIEAKISVYEKMVEYMIASIFPSQKGIVQNEAEYTQKLHTIVSEKTQRLLHDSCRRDLDTRMLPLLLETLKIDPNTINRQGMTPLQFAARSGKDYIVEYLLSLNSNNTTNNVDVNATDNRGKTALDSAIVNNKKDIVELLQKHGANVSSSTTPPTL